MEELMSIGTNIATLIAIGVATVSAVIVAFAGFQYATAAGDPQKVGLAKSSFVGAFIGLVIASLAFIGPRIVTDMVIKPVGGVALDTQVGLNCDSVLRNQLIFQRGASTKDRMQVVISQIQAQQQECAKDVWKPVAIDLGGGLGSTGVSPGMRGGYWGGWSVRASVSSLVGGLLPMRGDSRTTIEVGDQSFPGGLTREGHRPADTFYPRSTSGRDSENNIIVYWADEVAERPSDAASCWLYFARLRSLAREFRPVGWLAGWIALAKGCEHHTPWRFIGCHDFSCTPTKLSVRNGWGVSPVFCFPSSALSLVCWGWGYEH